MGIDTDVLLRVRDRVALREAFEARAAAERKSWADEGREADYEELLAGGYSPTPLIRPLEDGSVSIFTGHRFHDPDMEFTIRCWLRENFGDLLPRIHDDPRGVFVSPDVCEPRAKTYDAIVLELANVGRFIDPSPPTAEEIEARERALLEYLAGMEVVRAAHDSGDEAAFAKALEAAPEAVRETWNASRVSSHAAVEHDAAAELVVDPATALQMRKLLGLPVAGEEGSSGGEGMTGLMDAITRSIEMHVAAAEIDPRGYGRVSMLLPKAVVRALDASPEHLARLDVQDRADLSDGSALLVTSRGDESFVLEAAVVAEALAAQGIDRVAIGPLPFFRESVGEEVSAAEGSDFDSARATLGERVEMLTLRTTDEWIADEKAAADSWLRGDS